MADQLARRDRLEVEAFYLITAENMLTEEGTRGTDSVGADRGQADACP